jgi:hypothetical protein
MLRKLFRNRFISVGLFVLVGLAAFNSCKHYPYDKADIGSGHDSIIEPQKANRLSDSAVQSFYGIGAERKALSGAEAAETGLPPDNYYGDPFYWIPGIAYETVHTSAGTRDSVPVLPPEKYDRLNEAFDAYQAKYGKSLSNAEAAKVEIDILTEGMSVLDAAKYIKVVRGEPYLEYAREFAECALSENTNDFETLLIWTELQSAGTPEKIEGYYNLLKIAPNSARVLVGLATNLDETHIDEKIRLLEKAVEFLGDDTDQGPAVRELLKTTKDSQAVEPSDTIHGRIY